MPVLALLLAVQSSGAQEEPPAEVFREELQVTEVLLDVLVTDRDDRVVLGLEREDFVVSEGEERVEVAAAAFYSGRRLLERGEGLAKRGVAVEAVARGRHFILFIQQQPLQSDGTRPSLLDRQLKAGRQLTGWLLGAAQPSDRVAVVSFRRGLAVHQEFTTDRQALTEAIEGAARGRAPRALAVGDRSSGASPEAGLAALPRGKELRRASADVYRALRLVADAVKSVPGRKNLIFVGRGFGDIGSHGNYQPERYKLDPTLRALNDANVAVYALDVTPPGRTYNLQIALRDLAAETGGRFYYDRANFSASLEEIGELTSGYYLLSYQSRRPAGASGYQEVRVATRNPELRIQARQGYLYGPMKKP